MILRNQRKLGIRRYTSKVRMYTGWPPIIALVDIFFLLLWFWVQFSSSVRLAGIQVELPRVKASSIAVIDQFVISIMPAGVGGKFRILFQNQEVDLEELQPRLADLTQKLTDLSRKPAPVVAILADRHVPYELVSEVLARVGNTGLNCFLPVMPPKAQPERRFEK